MRSNLRLVYKYIRAIVRSVLIVTNNFYCIPTHVLWLWLLTPVRKYVPAVYYQIEGYLFSWLLSMVALWSWSAGYDIVEEGGDDITRCLNKRTLVLVNHQSTADVPLLMAAFNAKPGLNRNVMWIMDRMFRYTNFGIVSSYHRDFFIASGKARRDESVRRLEEHLKNSYIPLGRKWMVLFPEGGFLTKRRPISQRFAAKNNMPVLQNVTLPRMGALYVIRDQLMGGRPVDSACGLRTEDGPKDNTDKCINNLNNNNNNSSHINKNTVVADKVDHLIESSAEKEVNGTMQEKLILEERKKEDRPELDYILDITIGYPDGGKPLNLQNIVMGLRDPCQTVFYYRVYSTSEIPKDDASLSKWTYDRFIDKESMLADFYKHNTFLSKDQPAMVNGTSKSNGQEQQVRVGSNGKGCVPVSEERGSYLVQQDLLRFVILHLFFITSTYFHYRVFAKVVENCISLYTWMVL